MSEKNFYSFMAGIKELAKTIKHDEKLVVDFYDPCGRKLNDDEI